MTTRSNDPRQMSLDALFMAPAPVPRTDAGCLDISGSIRETLADILADAKQRTAGEMDRFAVATQMSRLAKREVTKHMLDRYCAASADDWRFPAEAIPALVQATGDYRLLDLIAEACGCRVLRGEEAWIAEVGALLRLKKEVSDRLAAYQKLVPGGQVEQLLHLAQKRHGGAA